MKLRAACLLLALGLAACRGQESIPGLSGMAKSCQSEPTQLCFQTPEGETISLPEEGLQITVNEGITARSFSRTGRITYGVRFAPPASGRFVPGIYRDAVPFGGLTSTAPLLDVEMPKSTCRGPGDFILYDVAFDEAGETVQRLDVAFEMGGCGDSGDQTVRGRIRLHEALMTGLRGRLARFFPAKPPEMEPAKPLDLAAVAELCPVSAERFFCLQGGGRAWVAAGRRQVIIHGKKGVGVYGSLDARGAVRISTLDVRPSGHTDLSLSFSPRRGTPLTPGLYESSGTDLEVGNCNGMQEPSRVFVYEADFDPKGTARHFLADFEKHCGGLTVVGRVAFGSQLAAKAKVEAGGDPERLAAALSRLLGERRRQIESRPRPAVSMEALDYFCPEREGSFFCLQGTAGDLVGGRSFQAGPPLITGPTSAPRRGGISVSFPNGELGVALAASPGEELRAGALYENAGCEPFVEEGAHLAVSALNVAASCRPEYRGRFRIRSLVRGEDGSIQSIAADFELWTLDGAPVIGRFRITDRSQAPPPSPGDLEPPQPLAEMTPSQRERVVVPEADARCSADWRTFERRGDVWMESGTERSQPTVTLTQGQDPKFDLMALKARIWTALNLGPKVRAYVDGKVTEILQGDGYPKDPFAGAHCEVFGKVRLPRRITEMGSALDTQLRQDGKRGLHVGARFLVGREGKVSELLAADGMPEEYRALLLQDLKKMTYTPAILDGRPVPVVQSGTLTY